MLFNYVKVHEIVSYELKENLYAGIGYHLDYYYGIKDEDLRLSGDTLTLTPHYYYSKKYGFDTSAYLLSGISANFVYDTRDNLVNPYKGYFVNVNYRYNPEWLGSEQNSSTLWVEFRTYIGLSKTTHRHLIGFWLFGNFTVNGNLPYLDLFALGDDQRSRSGRGYLQGRYRGDKFIYGEAEYRFPISKCSKILGGVVFVNACTASNPVTGVRLFNYIRPAVGAGLRIMVNKYFRTNINIDFSIGLESNGLYFSGQEAF
jgi:outer membrane protein assembly factor BamA